tara:strand:- start:27446 stop:28438 length:993 start_codon:yes stop_codon:yes gene_type:complete
MESFILRNAEICERRLLLTAPVAAISGDTTVDFGMDVNLDGYSSYDMDSEGWIDSYDWDVNGDGVYGDQSGDSLSLYWSDIIANGGTAGSSYTIGLQVTDNEGETATDTFSISLGTSANPIAVINGDSSLDFGSDGYFDGYSSYDQDESGSSIVSYDWDLNGDGVYGDQSGDSLSLYWSDIIANGGTAGSSYTIGLQVTDNEGETATDTFSISLGQESEMTGWSISSPAYDSTVDIDQTGGFVTISGDRGTNPDGKIVELVIWDLDSEESSPWATYTLDSDTLPTWSVTVTGSAGSFYAELTWDGITFAPFDDPRTIEFTVIGIGGDPTP